MSALDYFADYENFPTSLSDPSRPGPQAFRPPSLQGALTADPQERGEQHLALAAWAERDALRHRTQLQPANGTTVATLSPPASPIAPEVLFQAPPSPIASPAPAVVPEHRQEMPNNQVPGPASRRVTRSAAPPKKVSTSAMSTPQRLHRHASLDCAC
jgi:hypothetical protein